MICTSHSVMDGQRHNNPLNPRCFCLQRPKRDGLLTHAIVEVAKALGGSFKLVNADAKNCEEDDSTAQGNITGWGHTNKSKKHK